LVLTAGLVYLFEAPRRTALRRWAIDVAIVLPVAWIAGSRSPKETSGLDLDRLRHIYEKGLDLLPAVARPELSAIDSTWLTVAILAVPAVAALVAWRWREDTELRRWTAVAGVALVMAAAGYLALFPAEGYNALDQGIGNRVNLAAGLGMVTLVYADLMLLSLLVMRGPLRPFRFVPALVAAAAIAIGYHDLLDRHQRDYRQAIATERIVIGSMISVHAPPASGATLYVVGHPFYVNGVPVFSRTADMRAATKIYLDPSFEAAPLGGLAKLVCRRSDVYPPGWGTGARAPYGRAIVVAVGGGAPVTIASRAQCLRGGFPLTPVPG
jgi:hypothetical protein